MTRTAVTVIGGGENVEHEVSLASARSVAHGLDPARYAVTTLTVGRDGVWCGAEGPLAVAAGPSLAAAVATLAGSDVVVPAVHGPQGEDGTLAALCALAHVPVVGSGVRAGAVAMDKWTTKAVAAALGIAVARGVLLGPADPLPPWSGPVVVKPAGSGSSHGVALVRRAADLAAAVAAARALDDRVLVEEQVTGREIDVAVLEVPGGAPRVSPPLEIVGDGIFDTATKYDGTAHFVVPASLAPTAVAALRDAAAAVFGALGCAGVARVDFFLRDDGTVVLGEVNTMPGLTAHSQVPRMFAADGLAYPDLLDALVVAALHRRDTRGG